MRPESCQTGFQPRHLVFQTLAIGGAGRNIALGLPARGGASKHKDMWGLGARIASVPFGQVRDDAFGAAIQFWRHRLIQRRDLSDLHKMPSINRSVSRLTRIGSFAAKYPARHPRVLLPPE